ncbi:MAG: nitroreductase, partial [Paracoccaceae bacterium]
VERIVTAACRAPSWCNVQPWQVIVTGGDATDRLRAALSKEARSAASRPDMPFPEGYSGVFRDRRRTCGWQLYDAVGVEKGDRAASAAQSMENFRFFGAPHVAVLTSEAELGAYGALDCGGFVMAFLLAAQALGVATIPQAAVAAFAPFLRRYFDIPENRLILCAISFGIEDTEHPANSFRTERAALPEIIDWRE